MAWTAADLEAVEDAIRNFSSSGAQEVRAADGRTVKYTSLTDLLNLRNAMRAELSSATRITKAAFRYGS